MMMSFNLSEAERHAYITGDVVKATLIAEIEDLRNKLDHYEYLLSIDDDNSDN